MTREITTLEELEALPVGSILVCEHWLAAVVRYESGWGLTYEGGVRPIDEIEEILPLTLLR